ncbi:MAG: type 4a pilus biogenesis protein PilO, partial [Epsilonproteobacteria bacterium]|nr:type 4a pilus biogenesis protein PilO [Campylobacterota bacterium]
VAYLVFDVINKPVQSFYKSTVNRKNFLKSQIRSHKSYLRSITINGDPNYKIKELDRKIREKQSEISRLRVRLSKLDRALFQLSKMLYTKENWSEFLTYITKRAKDNNLKVEWIENQPLENNSTKKFGAVLKIGINCKGQYGNILAFINDLEQSEMVTDVYSTLLKPDIGVLDAEINVTIWGMKP